MIYIGESAEAIVVAINNSQAVIVKEDKYEIK